MATMSYCAIENSAKDLEVALDKINENTFEELNKYEQQALPRLIRLCRIFVKMAETLDIPEDDED